MECGLHLLSLYFLPVLLFKVVSLFVFMPPVCGLWLILCLWFLVSLFAVWHFRKYMDFLLYEQILRCDMLHRSLCSDALCFL